MATLEDFQVTDDVTDVLADHINRGLGSIFRGNFDNATTMSGTVTLADADVAIQRFNCDGANRIVKLPAASAANHPFLIVNVTAATYTIELQTNGAAFICTIATNGGAAFVIPDGTAGFKLVGGDALLNAIAPAATPYFLNAPEGTLLNGKITPTVASNDLILTLQTLAGNNPSAAEPVWIKLGGAWRSITAALAVTAADATNWCNSGSAELATKEIEYFAYLGYNATDGVVIGFSRVPWGKQYSDFNTTSSNERYCKISTITNAAAADPYVVIGRFAATLSAGAGYTWTVPTFTPANLVQYPIFETRWLTWAPTYSCSGSMTYTSVTSTVAKYKFQGNEGTFWLVCSGTTGGTASNGIFATIPFTPSDTNYAAGNIVVVDGSGTSGQGTISTNIQAYKYNAANFNLAAGIQVRFMGNFQAKA